MKIVLICVFLISLCNANESEKFFWDEVKNTSDVELLKLYKKQYPNGTFEKIADLKIKRLKKMDQKEVDNNGIPYWIKGTTKYKFYGVGKANKHFKGKHYQENLARSRARSELQDLFDEKHLDNATIEKYNHLIEMKKYTDKRKRIYILLYIDDDDLED